MAETTNNNKQEDRISFAFIVCVFQLLKSNKATMMSDPTKCYSLNEHSSSRLVLVQMKLANLAPEFYTSPQAPGQ